MRSDNLDFLKAALHRVELNPDPSQDAEQTLELKRLLVGKIAKLELVKAIEESNASLPVTEIVRLPLTDDEDL